MNTIKQKVHFVHPYLINPTNPVSVNLIGAGGNGSQMLTCLARMNHALMELGHAGLQVNLFDEDTIQKPNLGRQLFSPAELGMNKSVALINRINRFFGSGWKAVPERFEALSGGKHEENRCANIIISCVDSVDSRIRIEAVLKSFDKSGGRRDSALYLLDFGNLRNTGQVFLSTLRGIKQPVSEKFEVIGRLDSMLQEYNTELKAVDLNDDDPSCSLAEALNKQDLFINSALVSLGASLLWNMFREGTIQNRGFFLNLKDFRLQPVAL